MLHVFLLILKIVGIVLAVALGLILLVLLTVLLVPVRYHAFVSCYEAFEAEAKVSWLLHLVSVPVSFRDGKLSARVKLFGIPIRDLLRNEDEKEEELEEFAGDKKEEETKEPARDEAVPEFRITAEAAEQADLEISKLPECLQKIKNLKYTIRRFCVKIKHMLKRLREAKKFAADERTKTALRLCLAQVLRLLCRVLPRKIEGELRFGMEDPALTGQLLGVISIFYPIFMDYVKITPDFQKACLEGELYARGRIRLITFAAIAWRLFWDKNIRYVYHWLNR